jgi:hypothetical protein
VRGVQVFEKQYGFAANWIRAGNRRFRRLHRLLRFKGRGEISWRCAGVEEGAGGQAEPQTFFHDPSISLIIKYGDPVSIHNLQFLLPWQLHQAKLTFLASHPFLKHLRHLRNLWLTLLRHAPRLTKFQKALLLIPTYPAGFINLN